VPIAPTPLSPGFLLARWMRWMARLLILKRLMREAAGLPA
jgi:hypothetical protein